MLPRNIIVQFHNSISPNLLTKAILDTDFLLLPTTGENFGHVIWESLSAGTPVIISNTTPWRELKKACVGWDISLKDPEMFIDVLNRCIQMEDDQYQKMSCAALDYCRLYLNNSDSLERNKQLFGIS
jgi:glycosyltransferase involved in cell wall biosynthesis